MAKLILPLGSSSASGQLGKSWVFFPWKGMNLVRTLVIPANPKTAAQVAQRTKFTSAVTEFHAATYTSADEAAWRRYALTRSKVMTWFNAIVGLIIDALVVDDLFSWIRNIVLSAYTSEGFAVTVEVEDDHVGYLRWGLTPTYMPNSNIMTYAGGPPKTYTYGITGMPSGTQIYFQVYHTEQGFQGVTGIGMGRSSAA